MKTKEEILEAIDALTQGIISDEAEGKKQDATDKAIYLSALKWVIKEEQLNEQEPLP